MTEGRMGSNMVFKLGAFREEGGRMDWKHWWGKGSKHTLLQMK